MPEQDNYVTTEMLQRVLADSDTRTVLDVCVKVTQDKARAEGRVAGLREAAEVADKWQYPECRDSHNVTTFMVARSGIARAIRAAAVRKGGA